MSTFSAHFSSNNVPVAFLIEHQPSTGLVIRTRRPSCSTTKTLVPAGSCLTRSDLVSIFFLTFIFRAALYQVS